MMAIRSESGIGSGRSSTLVYYLVLSMPFVTLGFGHMAAIVGLGAWRTASQKLRRFRKAFP